MCPCVYGQELQIIENGLIYLLTEGNYGKYIIIGEVSEVILMLSLFLITLGLIILALTFVGAFGTLAHNWWDERATQGTIILTTMGLSLIVLGSHLIS